MFNVERITTLTTYYVERFGNCRINYRFCLLKTHSEPKLSPPCSINFMILEFLTALVERKILKVEK